jgi:type III restriction enzyme
VVNDAALEDPIINSPYLPPERYFEIGHTGPTGRVLPGRRPSESFIPIPQSKKGRTKAEQVALDFDTTGERREINSLINDIRREVDLWRARAYPGVTPISRKLLQHWEAQPPEREDPMLFCQREAAETAIFLAEAAGRHGVDYRNRLRPENALHNAGLPRVGLKMATGSGKTVVMAMLIAWQTINKVFSPRDARFAKRFLVVAPGITIRDRLRVIDPTDPGNYYRERDLVPPDLWEALLQAQVSITNYHAFLLKDDKIIQGVAGNTRKLLTAGKSQDPFRETPGAMVARVLRDLGGKGEIVVLNDEAHHCYQDKPLDDPSEADKEDKDRNADARVWFKGLQAVQKRVGIKTVYDLSATPFYLKGSGYNEGYIFPWVVSDFSLMDAIESGIVKIPRVPVDDDAGGDLVTYLHLWEHVGDKLPKRKLTDAKALEGWVPPDVLEGALHSLHRSYAQAFERWESGLAELGEPPPVMIVVCPNTVVSKLVYDWIAGGEAERPDGEVVLRPGELPLLSNVVDGRWARRQRTILIDSAQLESGEAMSADFKKAAAHEIAGFKAELRNRNPGTDLDKVTDEDLLREVMNTVGKKGKLGEHVRCVVSVSMLTEGWDANTVTHILGIRAFRSQLLCEQVIGRGLRRRSYAVNDEGRFDAEYAEVYGVPFAFIPTDRPIKEAPPKPPAVVVQALDERAELRITFPKLDGYRLEIPDEPFFEDFSDAAFEVSQGLVALWTKTQGVVGAAEEIDLDRLRHARVQEIAYQIARTLVRTRFTGHDSQEKPWLFPQLVSVSRSWLTGCVTLVDDTPIGVLLLAEGLHHAAEILYDSVLKADDNRNPIIQPLIRRFDPEGSTDAVVFATRKRVIDTTKSHVSHVVLDGPDGNTWEQIMALMLEGDARVASYVKNDHLGFAIPYVHQGRTHDYVPDFLARLVPGDDGVDRTLVVEVSGGRKASHSPGSTAAKAATARNQWCAAVNNHGAYGRWGYTEVTDMVEAPSVVDAAIESLYGDGPVTGLVDLIDIE